MLYKKIHRQCVRQYRVGRKFRCINSGNVYEVTGKLYIDYPDGVIGVMCKKNNKNKCWSLIVISRLGRVGETVDDVFIEWLN